MLCHAIFNVYWEPLEFEFPPVVDSAQDRWRRWIDTALASPHDIVECEEDAPTIGGYTYRIEPRSVDVLFAPLDAKEV
jgi:isoamylase